jgi:hypothetical protein
MQKSQTTKAKQICYWGKGDIWLNWMGGLKIVNWVN